MTATLPQNLRADAQENRDRVLDAARELFARSGLDVTMRQIARHADVGPATLYRRFPTKRDLVLEAMRDEFAACRAIVHDAAADPDPWRGFSSAVDGLLALNASNQGFTDAFFSAYPDVLDLAAHRTDLTRTLSEVARRAMAAGGLRDDFVFDDLLLVLLASRGLATLPATLRTPAARRLAAIALDGFRAGGARPALPTAARLVAVVGKVT